MFLYRLQYNMREHLAIVNPSPNDPKLIQEFHRRSKTRVNESNGNNRPMTYTKRNNNLINISINHLLLNYHQEKILTGARLKGRDCKDIINFFNTLYYLHIYIK